MSNASTQIALGTVYGDHSKVSEALSEMTGQPLGHVQIFGLAGPNELVQILASVEGWKIIGGTILTIYGSAIVSEAGKDTWKALSPRLRAAPAAIRNKFLKLVNSLQEEKESQQDVSIGLIEPTFDTIGRADRVYLTDFSPEEIARYFYIYSQCALPLSEWLISVHAAQTEHGYISVKMEISDQGELSVILHNSQKLPSKAFKKVFNAQGKVIEELSS